MRVSMVTVAVALTTLVALSGATSDDHHNDHWCHGHHEALDAISAVRDYVNSSATSDVTFNDLDDVIQEIFLRVNCPTRDGSFFAGITCSTCLTATNVYQVLGVDPSVSLDADNFAKASVIILAGVIELEEFCGQTTDWTQASYDGFVEMLVEHVEHLEEHGEESHGEEEEHGHVTFKQINLLLEHLNENYLPGVTFDAGQAVCDNEDQESFRARDIVLDVHTDGSSSGDIEADDLHKMAAQITARLLEGQCIVEDRAASQGLPDPEDFVTEIFLEFGDEAVCTIEAEGLARLGDRLGLDTSTLGHSDDEENGDHDDHGDHGDGHDHKRKRRDVIGQFLNTKLRRTRVKRSSHDHDHEGEESFLPSVDSTCMNSEDLLKTFDLDPDSVFLDREDFELLAPALVQQSAQGCYRTHADEDEGPTSAEKYGYGTLAVFLISATSFFGLFLVKARGTRVYTLLMSVMLGLAFGSLAGDALMHLVPHALGLHNHEEDEHNHDHGEGIVIEPFVYLTLAGTGAVWFFLILQMLLMAFGNRRSGSPHSKVTDSSVAEKANAGQYKATSNGIDNTKVTSNGIDKEKVTSNGIENQSFTPNIIDADDVKPSNGMVVARTNSMPSLMDEELVPSSVGWMITIGDSFHNFADGMAIGAAFALDWETGISTSIAIFCHEIPHEFGDTAVMFACGWSTRKVALLQFVATISCFVGFYIGAAVSESSAAQEWIFIIASGMFLYIALSDIVPEIMEVFLKADKDRWPVFACVHAGALLGIGVMLIIAIFEESINIGGEEDH